MNLLPTATSIDVQEQQPQVAVLPIGGGLPLPSGPRLGLCPRVRRPRIRQARGLPAGEIETSILLHAPPGLGEGYADADHDGGSRSYLLVHGMAPYTQTGVIGFPSFATAVEGKAVLESLQRRFEQHLMVLGEQA